VASFSWVHASAPARIDLSGGWSDTPPITYESGGLVVNVAVNLVANKHALGASCRRTNSNWFELRFGRFDDVSSQEDTVKCASIKDFQDHNNPKARAALLKCVLLALFPVSFPEPFGGLELWFVLLPSNLLNNFLTRIL
jgi:fucokinase